MNPRHKKIIFVGIMALLPLLVLASLEGVLRITKSFAPEPFIFETKKNFEKVYQINPRVALRYFDPQKVSVPGAIPATFAYHKPDNTFRIFCLGGSTTAGFPFDCQVAFPVQLRYLLSQTYPDVRFEVINCGISAINSFTVVDLLPEILEHEPDLILFYMGHNEFYGAYGSASTISLGARGALIRQYLKLQKLHLVQMLKRGLRRLTARSKGGPAERSLMASVIGDQEIPYGSEKYLDTRENFRLNLKILFGMCEDRHVPVVVSNLVANERDFSPFTSPRNRCSDTEELARADSLYAQGAYIESLSIYRELFASDSSAAELWYKLGRVLVMLGDSLRGQYYLAGARDRDVVRFRATHDFNADLEDSAGAFGFAFVDMQEIFRRNALQDIIGSDLICDHLHPNPRGYYLMAKGFYDAIRELGLPSGQKSDFSAHEASPYFVSDLDWDIGLLKIFKMVHRFPFPEQPVTYPDYQPHGDTEAGQVALDYLFKENIWSRAKYKMAGIYLKKKAFEKARREYLAVSLYTPDDPYPLLQVAKTYELTGDWSAREHYLKKVLPLSKNRGLLYYHIALAQWQQHRLQAAIGSMNKALTFPDLNRASRQNARFYLAGFYADTKNLRQAVTILRNMLQEDPSFQPARAFLQRLYRVGRRNEPERGRG